MVEAGTMSENDTPDEGMDIIPDTLDMGGLFRGTATVTFVIEIVTAIMMLGAIVARIISLSGLIEVVEIDIAVFLLLVGSMITLFFFLGAIGFFVRFNRRIGRAVIGEGIGSVDLDKPGVKLVVTMYGVAVGLILFMGMYGYYILWKYYLSQFTVDSIAITVFSLALGIFILAFLIQVVLVALGRTATSVVKKVFAENATE